MRVLQLLIIRRTILAEEVLKSFSFLSSHLYTSRMEPIAASLTLNHQIVWVVGHLTLAIHGNAIGGEGASGRVILKTTEEIVVSDGIQLGVALEAVDRTLAFDCVGALDIEVVGEEQLLRPMELTAATDRLLRPVVPPHVHPHAPGTCVGGLYPLHPRHVGRLRRLRRPHQHAVPRSDGLVNGFDGVGVESAFRNAGFRHGFREEREISHSDAESGEREMRS